MVLLLACETPDPVDKADTAAGSLAITSSSPANTPPTVSISAPGAGEWFVDDEEVVLLGTATDPDQPSDTLDCTWWADAVVLLESPPAADTTVTGSATLPAALALLTLRCTDADGAVGEASVSPVVWDRDEPMEYHLGWRDAAGHEDSFDVDDDLTVLVDGEVVYADMDTLATTIAPISFYANYGATIELIATDWKVLQAVLPALTLGWGPTVTQPLNADVCYSISTGDPCYDAAYPDELPYVFYDGAFVIEIP